MRRFTHTFPQRISAFLLCLALLVSLLPLSALAADGIELYVGGQLITESGCYENQNGTWTKVDGTEPANGQFSYDADTFTLTLNQAMIVNYQDVTVGGGFTYPGSVIAFSQSADVSLTIEVSQGTSNITGTGGIRVVSKAGDASLSISGPGSLEVKNVSNDSGIVLIGSKNVNLGINSADVTISNVQYYGVQLAAGDACKSTATINDGNLTVSDSVVGIYFMRLYTSGPSSLTVSGNAMVDTEGKTGGIINGFPDSFQIGADGESGGIVFNGNSGTVYGNVTLQEDLEIGKDETLTIPDGSSLDTDGNLTNSGTIINNGTLTGEVGGSGTVTPKITTDSLPNGTVGESYTATLEATGNNITWSASGLPAGLTLNSDGTITGTPTAEGTSTVTVKAENSAGSTSKDYTLNIKPATVSVTGVNLNKTSLPLTVGGTETLIATVKPDTATDKSVTWESSDSDVATVEDGTVTAKGAGEATITVKTVDGGYTATCAVTVEKPYTPPPYIPPTYAVTVPETTGGTVTVSPSRASSGRRVTITTQPAPGYELESLTVLDSRGSEIALTVQGDGKYTFTMPASRVTVQASFAPVPLPFEDVPPGAWYEEAVRYAYTHGIMEGMSATTFVPGKSLTRAEAVQVLYNLEGLPTVSESTTFPDLVYEWYKPAIAWAESTGVVDGYEDGTFQPGDSITRQEFAQMLYNYAKYKGYDLSAEGDLSQFPDSGSVADWAEAAMSWANGNELINGHDDGTLDPAGTTTRVQAASILMRFDLNVAEN